MIKIEMLQINYLSNLHSYISDEKHVFNYCLFILGCGQHRPNKL